MTAPQRPPAPAVAAMRAAMGGGRGLWLQLGVTPEIAQWPERSVAVDWNAAIVESAWPGVPPAHHVLLGDWRALPIAPQSIDGVIGDGSLTMLRWADEYHTLLYRLAELMRPGGRAVLRCFTAPEEPETGDAVRAAAMVRDISSFAALRMRFNMAVAAETGGWTATSAQIHAAFDRTFPDRDALAHSAGWSRATIDTIDLYAGSDSVHSYPPRAALREALPPAFAARFVDGTGYELAECCPILILERR